MARDPNREFWAKLHVPALRIRKLGYYYVDPTGGHSFRDVCDLDAATPEVVAAAAREGFGGGRILRLNGFESFRSHPSSPPEMEHYNAQDFERGGHHGTVVWELSEREQRALGLPVEPPWAAVYRGELPAPPAAPSAGLPAPGHGMAPHARRGGRMYPYHWAALIVAAMIFAFAVFALVNPPSYFDPIFAGIVMGSVIVSTGLLGWVASRRFGLGVGQLVTPILGCLLVAGVMLAYQAEESDARWAFRRSELAVLELCNGGGAVAGPTTPGTVLVARELTATGGYFHPSVEGDSVGVVAPGELPERVACVAVTHDVVEEADYRDTSTGDIVTLSRTRERVNVRVFGVNDGGLVGETTLLGGMPPPFRTYVGGGYDSRNDAPVPRVAPHEVTAFLRTLR